MGRVDRLHVTWVGPLQVDSGALASVSAFSGMYQLVLPFAPWDDSAFDALVDLQDRLEELLGADSVDGHDLGGGEANIFVVTPEPARAFSWR